VKPNFAWPNPLPDGPRSGGLFVGRLTSDKGLALLAAALRQVPELAFDVAGSGPDAALLDGSGARMLGALGRAEVQAAMRRAAFLLVPSSRAEQFPRVLAEAFASGLPVIVAGFGALAEWVDDGRTGLHFRFGDAGDLAVRLRWALAHPAEMAALGRAARADYERRFGPEAAHAALMSIYAEARATAAGR
jgi:glycosyltransferase involved in cell wall biosynthesis